MLDAVVQRGFALRTQDAHVRAIRRMAKHYRRDPAQCTRWEVQAYLLHMVRDESLSPRWICTRVPDVKWVTGDGWKH